ncbi:hypothetical protein Xvie_02670 [Xenorhabdus vietnamensis]|uniref:Uncharacterized protein n=1 Tax=Xenorhabdus vietnamensis TaxID=351656 RepID=A0A1Y2SA79_9GAMM|nr:hypothetical protein [Xenorhabdus vietnamensis]OTA15588.1 hypothetical protein Xvie_02670 [Xenorhabdus vietnamensis]
MINKEDKLYNSDLSSVTLSVPKDSDVVIGQSFYLYITIILNGKLPSELDVNLDVKTGLAVDSITKAVPLPSKQNAMQAIAYLTIDDKDSLKPGDQVSYKLSIPNIYSKEINYTANLIDLDSLQLSVDKYYCILPQGNTNIGVGNNNFIRYSANLNNNNGKGMKNTPIQISASIKDDLNEDVIITTDPDDGLHSPVQIIPIDEYDQVVVPIVSNNSGKISFRVYPMKDKPVVLQLGSEIPGGDEYFLAPTVYMLSPRPKDPREYLPVPTISNFSDGQLKAYGSDYTFDVKIEPYHNAYDSDSLIFFIDDKIVLPISTIGHSNPPNYSFKLYYDMFTENKESKLYYVIAPRSGNNEYSKVLPITYIGSGDNIPSDKISRVYEKPIVYSSWANPKSHPPLNNDDDIIDETYYINSFDIKNGRKEYSHNHNNGGYGLFVKITGTKDTQDKYKPKFGDTVHFTMYLNGGFYKNERVHEKDVKHRKDISRVIKDVPDHSGGNTSTTVVYIEYEQLVGFSHDSNNGQAMIYFEYYFYNEGNRIYSDFWSSKIETSGN